MEENKGMISDGEPSTSKKVVQTALVTAAYFLFGLITCQEGVIFLDLVYITGSNVTSGSLIFTMRCLGFVVGVLLICPLMDKFNNDKVFCACLLCSGLITLAMPLCKSLMFMAILYGARSFFIGPATSGSSVILTKTWLNDSGPFLQNMQFFFAIGGLIAPFVTEPFLMDRISGGINFTISHTNGSAWNTSGKDARIQFGGMDDTRNLNSLIQVHQAQMPRTPQTGDSRVEETFFLTGGLILALTSAFVVKTCLYSSGDFDRFDKNGNPSVSEINRSDPLASFPAKSKTVCYFLLGINSLSYGFVSRIVMSFLMTFALQFLGMNENAGSLMNTTFWAGYAVGRLLGVFLIKHLQACTLLLLDFAGLLLIFIAMALVDFLPWGHGIWFGLVGSCGLFMGSVLATKIYWLDTVLTPITGKIMTLVFVCNISGMMTQISLLGYLFEHFTPMWFVYLLLFHASLLMLTFIGLAALTKYFTRLYCHSKNLDGEAKNTVQTSLEMESLGCSSSVEENLVKKSGAHDFDEKYYGY